MESGFVLLGEDRLPPYSIAAIHAAGLSHGDRVTSMKTLGELDDAEAAASEAANAIFRAQIESIRSPVVVRTAKGADA